MGKKSTITKQLQILNPPGLTIVARVEIEREELLFKDVIEKIQAKSGKKLYSNKCLHFTLIGLFNDKRECKDSDTDQIINSTKEFIEQEHLGIMTIRFNLIRPGAFYNYGRPCDFISDGTLVIIADNESPDVNKFNILGDDLACHLRKSFPTIFYPDVDSRLKREHPTVWITLGYFREPDFEIDEKLVPILEQMRSFNATVTVSQLEIRSYETRSLDNSNLVAIISL